MGQKKAKPKYTKQPDLVAQSEKRLYWVMAAMTGATSKAEAAKQLGLSRTQLHNLLNQTTEAMVEAVTPKIGGRPSKPEHQKELEQENQRLRRENQQLRERVDTVDRLLAVASEMMKTRTTTTPRRRKKRSTTKSTSNQAADDDPDLAPVLLEAVQQMRGHGLSAPLAAAVVGCSPRTTARWACRQRLGLPPRYKRGGGPPPLCTAEAAGEVRGLVRELRGQVGAAALGRTISGISRRQAARVKSQTLSEMERERRQTVRRVVVVAPNVIRGFDAMRCTTREGPRHALIAGDAAVPYRTLAVAAARYDTLHVAQAIERDLDENGAPLVYRLDRASCHRTSEVDEVLDSRGVLRLHGPPRHPGYYGQLERQNREHRAWLTTCGELQADALADELVNMRRALNALKPRPMLGYRTAESVWNERLPISENRQAFRDAVADRTGRIAKSFERRGNSANPDLIARLAIEQTLTQRGHLRCQPGGWC